MCCCGLGNKQLYVGTLRVIFFEEFIGKHKRSPETHFNHVRFAPPCGAEYSIARARRHNFIQHRTSDFRLHPDLRDWDLRR
jgi:hypothetical protein